VRRRAAAGGEALTGPLPINSDRAAPPRRLLRGSQQLSGLIGHRLLVGITFLDGAGQITAADQFCGRVLEVTDGVVVVERPGEDEPAVLPADSAAYRRAETGKYTLTGTGEIVVNPEYICTWQVAADRPPNE
jgi:hypothetical protein